MRSPKRYLLVAIVNFLILIFVYVVISKLDSNIEEVSKPLNDHTNNASRRSLIGGKDFFDRFWSFKKNLNFTESRMKIKYQVESQSEQVTSVYNEASRTNQSLLDYINYPPRVLTFDFSDCRMSNCFDFSRCRANGPLKVHIVPSWKEKQSNANMTPGESNLIHQNVLKIIKESNHYEPNPEKACIFVLEDDTLDRDPLSQSFRSDLSNIFGQNNNYGMNYLIFNLYSGSWPDYMENDFAGLQFGAAILAKASNSISHHRPGFDISLPLFSYLHPYSDSDKNTSQKEIELVNDRNRTHFLTFKGKRYVFGSGSETRNSLYHLNNQRDVIMLTTCRHGKKWRDSSDSRCSDEESSFDQHDFVDLMKKSTFCLTPRGRRLGSFRYLEALSFGCIPVILSDGWVKPFDEIIEWSYASVQFDESLLLQVPDILRDINSQTTNQMRNNCRALYKEYFSTTEKIILTTLSIIEQRVKNQIIQEFKSTNTG